MESDIRKVVFDTDLGVEAYRFRGIMQEFPNHFHEYYVIGFMENGRRSLTCNGTDYVIDKGDLLLLNPRDNHTCKQIDGKTTDYRCINIQPETMRGIFRDMAGVDSPPCFTRPVAFHSELTAPLKELHSMIMREEPAFKKEEAFLFLLEQLIGEYTDGTALPPQRETSANVMAVCRHIERHYAHRITLEDLSKLACQSKFYLLRSFTLQMGISPYRYLETVRAGEAKKMLERGTPIAKTAMETGFSDQSHFSNFFKKIIGLSPGQYRRIFANRPPEEDTAGE